MTNRDHYTAGSMRVNEQGYEGVSQAPLPRPAGVPGVPRPPQAHPGVGPGPRAMPPQGVPVAGPHAHHPQATGRGAAASAAAAAAAAAAAGAARVPAATPGPRVRPLHETCDLREQFLTPEDLRDSFTQYIVFRFEKIPDEDRYDADGQAREEGSTWLYARRTRVCDREQRDILGEIRDIARSSTEPFAARRKALSNEQRRQVENTLEELLQDEPDPARFETTLVQLDEKFETLTDKERREYDRRRGRRSETYRTTSSGAQVKRKKKKRVAITAYYKRSPKPDVDIGQLIKERQAELLAQTPGGAQLPPVHQQRQRQQQQQQQDAHGFPTATAPPQPRVYNGQGEGYATTQANAAPRAPPMPPPYAGAPGYPGQQQQQPPHGQLPPRPVVGAQSAHPANAQHGAPGGGVNAAAVNSGGVHSYPPPHVPPPPVQRGHPQGATHAGNAAPQAAHGGGGGGGGDNRRRSTSRHHSQPHDRHRRPQGYRGHAERDDLSSSVDSASECGSVYSESTDEDQSTECTSDDQASMISSDRPSPKRRHQRHESSHQVRRRRPSLHQVYDRRPYRSGGHGGRRYSTGGQTAAGGGSGVGYGYVQPSAPPPPLIFNAQQPVQPTFVPSGGAVPVTVVQTPTTAAHPQQQPMDPAGSSLELANEQIRDAFDIVYIKGLAEGRRQQAASETMYVAASAAARQQPRAYHPRHPPSPASTSAGLGGARYADAAEVDGERRRVDRLEQIVKNLKIDTHDPDRDMRRDREDGDERRYGEGTRYHWSGGGRRDGYGGGGASPRYGIYEQDRDDARRHRELRRGGGDVDGRERERERERFDRRPSPHGQPWPTSPDRREGFMYGVGRDSWADLGGGSGHGAGYSPGMRRRGDRGYYPG
ncbi:hypothetical protein GGTG_01789 [Gaeumannomyces tritici R3-111a-1]|uniref:Uncharacterized protein n=1 Tax=Gaeumannomyces tritici (strain R3-111a-1) TaxID=644352 RepID=J3NKJ8_GAET3|nr:hypothetical protein GGTG_01789 [Gaeumannomyces tritici R3-111a-1]EJT81815.1 hypothetical protein GGTG_01789 [Gaeumannomyces tritici R3-111a-1]